MLKFLFAIISVFALHSDHTVVLHYNMTVTLRAFPTNLRTQLMQYFVTHHFRLVMTRGSHVYLQQTSTGERYIYRSVKLTWKTATHRQQINIAQAGNSITADKCRRPAAKCKIDLWPGNSSIVTDKHGNRQTDRQTDEQAVTATLPLHTRAITTPPIAQRRH